MSMNCQLIHCENYCVCVCGRASHSKMFCYAKLAQLERVFITPSTCSVTG